MWKKWNCLCFELRHLKFDASNTGLNDLKRMVQNYTDRGRFRLSHWEWASSDEIFFCFSWFRVSTHGPVPETSKEWVISKHPRLLPTQAGLKHKYSSPWSSRLRPQLRENIILDLNIILVIQKLWHPPKIKRQPDRDPEWELSVGSLRIADGSLRNMCLLNSYYENEY